MSSHFPKEKLALVETGITKKKYKKAVVSTELLTTDY